MTLRPSWFTGKRLQTRLILWTGVILIVSITTASEIRTRYNIHLLESNLRVRSETLVGALNKNLGHMASSLDLDTKAIESRLREFVEADRTLTRLDILRSNTGASMLATSSDQRVPAVHSVAPELTTRIETLAGERVMVTSAPLEGTPFALVALSSLENIDRYQETNRWITWAFSLFLIVIVIPPMFLLYSRTISRRFDELLEGIRRAQQGEASRIPDDREDEIGVVAKTFNALLTQVRTFNDGLQLEVSRATQDLHKRNLALEETSRQMLAMQRQLLESERLATVGQMAATFAHEIGSPMSSLSAHVQLLLEDSRLSDDQRETLLVVREQIQSVVQIVNDLLRSARRGPSDFVLTDLNGILETVVRLVQPKLTSQRIDVAINLQPIPFMRGYPLYLQEVFLNLINNASEAMPGGGRLEVRSWYDERRELLNVSIFDTGPGIDPSVVEKMFDHFVTTKAIGAGTGLGLGIVKEIVDSHRGTIHIAPMGGRGTSAHITFPGRSFGARHMSTPGILVVDDDESALKALMQVLRKENYQVDGASSGPDALQKLARVPADLVITDIRMGRMDGMELMRELHARWPNLPVIVMTAFASIDTAIRSIHEGAYDYISKPYEVDDLRLTVRRALEQARLARENIALRQNLAEEKEHDVQMIGMSPQMIEVYKMIARVAPTGATVLIEGESGSGKELIARAIHANSDRREQPFIALNCGAVTETLLETELFGHIKGAFTGASYAKQGLFEAADKGTIFLDEIGETSAHMQTRMLRVLEEREIQRVGSVERTPVDIRVIAATNRPLQQLVARGKFREDLFYRLNVVAITVPPLRERLTDLPLLFDHFLKRHRRRTDRTTAVHGDVLDMLREYSWPGNVRELENMVERAVTLNTSGVLTTADFAEQVRPSGTAPTEFSGALVSLEEMERRYSAHVISRCNGNMTRAAEILQIDRRTLYRMLERFAQRNIDESENKPVG